MKKQVISVLFAFGMLASIAQAQDVSTASATRIGSRDVLDINDVLQAADGTVWFTEPGFHGHNWIGEMYSSATAGTFKNASHYSNPKVDALLEQALRSTDQAVRAKLYEEVTRIVRRRLEEICSQIENQSTVQVLPLQKLVAVQVGTGLHALAAWKEFAGAATPA